MREKQVELEKLKETLEELKEQQRNANGEMTILAYVDLSNRIKGMEKEIEKIEKELKKEIHNIN